MSRKKIITLITCLVFLILPVSSFAKKNKIYLNFNQIEIKNLLEFISKELGKNIIYDGSLRGKVTIISSKPVDKKTVWKMITQAISLVGGVIYQERNYIKVVSRRLIREYTPETAKKLDYLGREPSILIYSLTKLNPGKVIRILRPLLSPRSYVSFISGTSILIIKDYADNLLKIRKFLKDLENEVAFPEIKVFKLKYALAKDVSRELIPVLQAFANEKGISFKLISDDRTNSIIVYGNKEVFEKVKEILKELDVPQEESERNFYVIPIKYVSAEELVKVLRSLNISRLQIEKKGRVIHTSSKLHITADKVSNSLIVYATPKEYEKIKELIQRLDIQRKQVLLATAVVEISLDKLRNLGVHWQAFGKYGGAGFGALSQTDIYTAVHQGNMVIGTFSPSGETFSIGGINLFFPDLLLLYSLLEEDSSFQILSNPKILTLDNTKAEIKVGESVPYTTGITYQTNTLPTVSFEYRDVGLDLVITPHICEDSVRLEISQTIQEVTQVYRASQGSIDFVAPVTSKRAITSQVIVKNGQTVILGGLISNKSKKQVSRVPWLSSIPLLGWLFKRHNLQEQKTTLFVFITPYIISSPEELKKITEKHKLLSEDLKKFFEFSKNLSQEMKF
jgi:general secretion pathway protein D